MFFINEESRCISVESHQLSATNKELTDPERGNLNLNIHHQLQKPVAEPINHILSLSVDENAFQLPKLRPHVCKDCGKTFLKKHHLSAHIKLHTGERPFICPECGKTFALRQCLNTHLLLHSSERPYNCCECNKNFTFKHHLVKHKNVHSLDRPFGCSECRLRFHHERHLITHSNFHKKRPYSCTVCGDAFLLKEHLVMHSRFHGGTESFVCPDCGTAFSRKFQLVLHERQHGRIPESCPKCGKEFLQKRTLVSHVKSCGLNSSTLVHKSPDATTESKACCKLDENLASNKGLAFHRQSQVGDHNILADIFSQVTNLKQNYQDILNGVFNFQNHD